MKSLLYLKNKYPAKSALLKVTLKNKNQTLKPDAVLMREYQSLVLGKVTS